MLYTQRGFLGTVGFLIALALAALGLGLWVGAEASAGRRWIGVLVAYGAGAAFALLWYSDPGFRKASWGGALAAFFLLAEPAYAVGAAYRVIVSSDDVAVAGFLGAAVGVVLSAVIFIPRYPPSVIFVAAAAVLLVVALVEMRRTPSKMIANDFSLNEKVAIVTGVGDPGQVGFAVAERLIGAGARVCITSLGDDIASLASQLGAQTIGVQANLANEDDVARLITTAREHFGRLDILVNVAGGLSVTKPIAETSTAEWRREVQRNAETVFLTSRTALPELRKSRGSIINFASPAGVRAVAQLGAYSAAKAGVIALTRALALEEKSQGVRVNALAPGMIDTAQNRASVEDPQSVKWVTREQIANAVVFLASDAATGVTGETINVMGEGIA